MTQKATTLYRAVAQLAVDYPLPDVIEMLGQVAFETGYENAGAIIDEAVDIALEEEPRKPKLDLQIMTTYIDEDGQEVTTSDTSKLGERVQAMVALGNSKLFQGAE